MEFGGKINEKGNAILIDSKKNHSDWLKAIKFLHKNPELIEIMGENLYLCVKEKYHIDVTTKTRSDLYSEIVKRNNKEVKQLILENNAI
jgi:hypothetical protein